MKTIPVTVEILFGTMKIQWYFILRQPILQGKYGLKLKVVLKRRDNYIENIKSGIIDGWS